jgi:hypothetical protein
LLTPPLRLLQQPVLSVVAGCFHGREKNRFPNVAESLYKASAFIHEIVQTTECVESRQVTADVFTNTNKQMTVNNADVYKYDHIFSAGILTANFDSTKMLFV